LLTFVCHICGLRDNSNEGDDDEGCVSTMNPAPAGTVAPPADGLAGNGKAPQVQMN